MKVVHLIGGGDVGGAKVHVLSLVKELSKNINVKIIALREGTFSKEARQMGLDIDVIHSKNVFRDIRKVIKTIRDGQYDFIHSHGAKANVFAVICKLITKIRVITTIHSDYKLDYLQSNAKRLTYGSVNAIALRYVDFYEAVSSNFRDMLIARDFPINRIYTVYNGIDFASEIDVIDKEQIYKKYNIEVKDNELLVGILARLHPVKDIPTFLKAAKKVLEVKKNVKFIIGGDGEHRAILKEYANKLGISDKVLFVGFVDNPYEFMSIIDINVLTSLSESFPYSILEGTKLKKATISSNVGGIFDLIEHNKNGYLFDVGDYERLSEYILNLLNDANLREKFGIELNKKASIEFSLDKMRETQLDIYYDIQQKLASSPSFVENNYDILLSGYYGHNNMGDEAMLEAIIETLRSERKYIKLAVLSQKPGETSKLHNIKSIYRFSIYRIFKTLIKTKVYINGGGSLIQDNTSNRSLYYYLSLIVLAKLTNTKVMIYANGIGPINKTINKHFTRCVLNMADIITVRDENSLKELERLKINKPKIELTADAALTLKSVENERIESILKAEGIDASKSLIGFSIRQWGQDMEYLETVAKVADIAYKKYNLVPVFIVMQKNNDLKISESIIKRMESDAYIIKDNYSPKEILGIISKLELLIGMRLHALIFASMSAVPCIGIVYEQKVEGFINYVRQVSAGSVKELKIEKLSSMLDEVYQDKRILKEFLLSIRTQLEDKSIRNAKLALELLDAGKKGK